MLQIIFFSIGLLFLIGFIYNIFFFVIERKAIKHQIQMIIGNKCFQTKEDFIKLSEFLKSTIRYDSNKNNAKRPFLRETALKTLKTQYGFCGENARLAILLLIYGGVRANRIYLFGKRWQHVLVEVKWKTNFYLFDGHNDKTISMNKDQILNIKAENFDALHNTDSTNPWIDFCRIKIFYKIYLLHYFSKIRLPKAIVIIFESPNIIVALFYLSLLLICLFTYWSI